MRVNLIYCNTIIINWPRSNKIYTFSANTSDGSTTTSTVTEKVSPTTSSPSWNKSEEVKLKPEPINRRMNSRFKTVHYIQKIAGFNHSFFYYRSRSRSSSRSRRRSTSRSRSKSHHKKHKKSFSSSSFRGDHRKKSKRQTRSRSRSPLDRKYKRTSSNNDRHYR